VIVILALAAAAPDAQAATWTVQSSPNPAGATSSSLHSVSCPSDTTCIAVGTFTNPAGKERALAERWNGTGWTLQTLPAVPGASQTTLASVSCASASACTAVGSATGSAGRVLTLAERWNGVHWTVQASPNPTPSLPIHEFAGVACPTASACVAVGRFGRDTTYTPYHAATFSGLIERWNGHHWTVQRIIHAAAGKIFSPLAVSCTSPAACMAVGTRLLSLENLPAAWRWNGQQWSAKHPSNHGESGELLGVSCLSAIRCVAVGHFFVSRDQNALAERWNGSHWSLQTPPRPMDSGAAVLTGVSCRGATQCTAVGGSGPADPTGGLAEDWSGISWTIQPTPGGDGWPLNGVACRQTFCTAAGEHGGFNSVTLAERYS
jgi:hypothetical protein